MGGEDRFLAHEENAGIIAFGGAANDVSDFGEEEFFLAGNDNGFPGRNRAGRRQFEARWPRRSRPGFKTR